MITVVRPGMLTTVQDRGRWGYQHLGIPVAGPMDAWSFRLANLLVANDEWAPALEVTLIGPHLQAGADLIVAVTGADLSASIPLATPTRLARGEALRFGARRSLTRAYVAVAGGIEVPALLGSRATSLSARLPGLAGRALRAGDVLGSGLKPSGDGKGGRVLFSRGLTGEPDPLFPLLTVSDLTPVRFMWGPDRERFGEDTARAFVDGTYRLSPDSNRMGYRLAGPALGVEGGGQVLSEASPLGSIQVPPSGQPILLMADRQTSGGYARIGTVITADLPVAGQLGPGDAVRFVPCERDEALAALRAQEEALRQVRGRP
jgi:antagonist of KipI